MMCIIYKYTNISLRADASGILGQDAAYATELNLLKLQHTYWHAPPQPHPLACGELKAELWNHPRVEQAKKDTAELMVKAKAVASPPTQLAS